ncbi:MAG: plasmid pRiA4b ORF-3 family protein [Clostridiales bacterium]|nr:plasmid pRiA4b ORF-3 family protein [Clostridiales bacterium]
MKAYQIKIEILGSEPVIWRRVIMPAGATFNRLHDVIQNALNFNSGYPHNAYHLFHFDLSEDNIRVTNDEEAYQEHQQFKKNRKKIEARLKAMDSEFAERQLQNLRTVIRKPTGIKIDKYLEVHGQINYVYDYGDDWRILISLEEVVEDYYYGYPTFIDGAEVAPPEDVGGLPGFYEFLKVYYDESHPEHEEIKVWAKEQGFQEYDPEYINMCLKSLRYKKTEWDKIEHKNFIPVD